jgi:hypothetical protein
MKIHEMPYSILKSHIEALRHLLKSSKCENEKKELQIAINKLEVLCEKKKQNPS